MGIKILCINLLLQFIIISSVFSQWEITIELMTSFEDDYSFIEMDTANPENIWQVGIPNKPYLNSSYTPPFSIITDTINAYPPNTKSSFQIKVKEPYENFCWSAMTFTFNHRFQTDTVLSGGYIEISYDGGENWINIINDEQTGMETMQNYYYTNQDTLFNGIPAFSGLNHNYYDGWAICQFIWFRDNSIAKDVDSVVLRFNFLSSTNENNKDGWLIDDIDIEVNDYCDIAVPENNLESFVEVFPNPSEDIINISINPIALPCDINIYDFQGKLVKTIMRNHETLLQIDCCDLSEGIYFYCITSRHFVKKETLIIN